MSYYDMAILEIVHAKSIKGYAQGVRYLLNNELGKEPRQIGRTKFVKMSKDLAQFHTNLKEFHIKRDKALNRQIAEEAYLYIVDKYILDEPK